MRRPPWLLWTPMSLPRRPGEAADSEVREEDAEEARGTRGTRETRGGQQAEETSDRDKQP